MDFRFQVADGYILEGLGEVRPEGFWRVYLRERVKSPEVGLFLGAVGRTPQEAIDKVQAAIVKSKQAIAFSQPMKATLSVDDLDF
jgi:hypothetical protein